jgi:hypothetical protein
LGKSVQNSTGKKLEKDTGIPNTYKKTTKPEYK